MSGQVVSLLIALFFVGGIVGYFFGYAAASEHAELLLKMLRFEYEETIRVLSRKEESDGQPLVE